MNENEISIVLCYRENWSKRRIQKGKRFSQFCQFCASQGGFLFLENEECDLAITNFCLCDE